MSTCLICQDEDSDEFGPVLLMHSMCDGCRCSDCKFHYDCFADWVVLKGFVCPICKQGNTKSMYATFQFTIWFWWSLRIANVAMATTWFLMYLFNLEPEIQTLGIVTTSTGLYLLITYPPLFLQRFLSPDRRNFGHGLCILALFLIVVIVRGLGLVWTIQSVYNKCR